MVEFVTKITLYKGSHADAVVYYRRGMDILFALRWKWYFEYLAALVKVAHPKERVDFVLCRTDMLTTEEYISKKRADLIKAKKGQLNRLANSNVDLDLFDIAINQRKDKIERIEEELQRLENGEITFYVYPEYINHVKDYINL